MTIQQINPASIAVYLTPGDLEARGYSAGALTLEQAFQLTRSACAELGYNTNGILEIEAFPDACGVLVFAKLHAHPQVHFSFAKFETVLSAVCALPRPLPDAALTYLDGTYYLSLAAQNKSCLHALSEYSTPIKDNPYFSAHLKEHGTPIFAQDALEQLICLFSSAH